ncbi:MAG: hypothetical protein H5T86_02625 [Armatimonadetes bacterium]|nr:hypothetical protein [Armatimonadota bacterium]
MRAGPSAWRERARLLGFPNEGLYLDAAEENAGQQGARQRTAPADEVAAHFFKGVRQVDQPGRVVRQSAKWSCEGAQDADAGAGHWPCAGVCHLHPPGSPEATK